MREKSLVVFTILSQLAAGTFWALSLLYAWAASQGEAQAMHRLARLGWPAITILAGTGMLAAFFHLGSPARAWRALSNLRQSWLSREILLAMLFGGACAILTGMEWARWGNGMGQMVVTAGGWLASLGLVYAMANAYRLRTVPAWDSWVTPVSFFLSALLLGMLASGALLGTFVPTQTGWIEASLRSMMIAATALLGVELAVFAMWLAEMQGSQAAAASFSKIAQQHGAILKLRLAMAVGGMMAICATFIWPGESSLPGRSGAVLLAFALVFAAEVAGRLLFYEARVRHGV